VQFTHTPQQLELRRRAGRLAHEIEAFEEPCEERGLPLWRPANALAHCTDEQHERYLIPVLGEIGSGYELTREWFVEERLMIAARALGAGERALTYQVAWEADNGLSRKQLHAKAAMVKLSASEAAGRVIDRAVQIFGGRGYMRENPVERLYRDIRVDRIWEGTSEIQRLIVAGEAAKRGLDGLLEFGTVASPEVARV
jgi:alkylation response protein AidB-like acyl-CoA dehydrogenase